MEKNIILSPMELEYFATGRHKLEGVTAQIIEMKECGFLNINEDKLIFLRYPKDEEPYIRILFNGLFYHTEEVSLNDLPLITAFAVQESIRYLEFAAYHQYADKEFTKSIHEYGKVLEKVVPVNFKNIYALGKGKAYAKSHDIDTGEYDKVFKALESVLTPILTPVGRRTTLGFGRSLTDRGPTTSREDVVNIQNIDWNYLLTRE